MVGLFIRYPLCGILILWSVFPIIWLISAGFKPPGEVQSWPPTVFPSHPTLEHLISIWSKYQAGMYLRNSLIVTPAATFLAIAIGCLSAYSIVRLKPKGKEVLTVLVLVLWMLPPVSIIIPLYLIFSRAKLIDNVLALIIAYQVFAVPFSVWIIKGFLQEMPEEFEDAARIDGCSRLSAFSKVTLPLLAPGLVAAATVVFLLCWVEFLFALILTNSLKSQTLPILSQTASMSDAGVLWGEIGSIGLLTVILPFIIVLFFQKYLIRGLTMGGLKY